MASQYANAQPAGYQNHVKNVALVGAGGNMGSHILDSLLEKGNHTITILSRPDSTNTFPAGVAVQRIDYNSHESLVSALKGQDVLIITLSIATPPEHERALIKAAADANVKWVFPNQWGQDFCNPDLTRDVLMLGPKLEKTRSYIEELGVSNWLIVTAGFWYEYSLGGTEWRYGFDFKEKSVTLFDDGTQKLNTSTWPQIGRAVAALLAFKILPDDANDTSEAVLSRFRNRPCYITSFEVSQREMWESAMRVTGTKESDWKVTHEDVKKRYQRGVDKFQSGDFSGFGLLMYARNFFPDGAGDYQSTKGISNELLGLPKEDLDTCTKGAIERFNKLAGTY